MSDIFLTEPNDESYYKDAVSDIECQYCQQPMIYSPLEIMEQHGIKVFFCHFCQYEETHWSGGNIASQNLYATINNQQYKWSVWQNVGHLFHIQDSGIPGISINQGVKQITSFNPAPKILQYNI